MKRKSDLISLPRAIRLSLIALPVALGSLPAAWGQMVVSGDGVSSSGAGSADAIGGMTFHNSDHAAYVLRISDGAELTAEDLTISSAGNAGGGAYIYDNGILNGKDLTISVDSGGTAGIYVERGGSAALENININAQGEVRGLFLNGLNSGASAEMSNSTVSTVDGGAILVMYGDLILNNVNSSTTGTGQEVVARALNVNTGSAVEVHGGAFSTQADMSDAVWVADASAILVANNGATFVTSGDKSHAVNAQFGTAWVTDSTLQTSGSGAYGLYSGGMLTANGLTIATTGEKGMGVFAAAGGMTGILNSSITTSGDIAAGMLVYPGSSIVADDVTVATSGNSAYGLWGFQGDMVVTNSAIHTQGEDAHGVTAQYATIDIGGSTVTATGAGASGIAVTGSSATLSSEVRLDSVTVSSASAAAISVSPSTSAFTVNNSTLTGGNGELMEVHTDVDAGGNTLYSSVALDASNSELNGTINVDDTGHTVGVTLAANSTLNGGANNVTSLSLDETSTWNMGSSSSLGQLTNNGTIVFSNTSSFDTLTVNGNYLGDGGLLVMNAVLGGSSSEINKLIVTGDVEAGTTRVAINNLGGQGAQLTNAIQLIDVGGTSYGTFVKSGRIVAGAYDYDLIQDGESWYLTSYLSNPLSRSSSERPEGGSYIANLAAANTMFAMRLNDRSGETSFIDALSGEEKVTSLWLRQVGSHTRWHTSSGGLDTRSNRYTVQLGGDVAQWGGDGQQRLHLGVMAGYGNTKSTTTSSRYGSKGTVEGYSTGVYATWYASDADKSGAWVDSWLQHGWFNNTVKGDSLGVESYRSKGFSASVETGYAIKLAEFGTDATRRWFIQPQAQLTWMRIDASNHTEQNGTGIVGKGDGNVQTRLGLRTWLQGHSSLDNGKGRLFQPFVEANWIHNARRFGVQMDDVAMSQGGAQNMAELRTGVEGLLGPHLSIWGNLGTQIGDNGYSDASATLGMKYSF